MSRLHRLTPAVRVLITLSTLAIAVHAWFGVSSDHGSAMSIFMITMAVACLPCTVSLVYGCSPRNLIMMTALAATSALVHGSMLAASAISPGTSGHEGHAAHGTGIPADSGPTSGHTLTLVVITALELGVLALTLHLHARRTIPAVSAVATPPRGTAVPIPTD